MCVPLPDARLRATVIRKLADRSQPAGGFPSLLQSVATHLKDDDGDGDSDDSDDGDDDDDG